MCAAKRAPRSWRIFISTLLYEHAVVAEHTVYVRKSASLLCTSHLGTDLVQDPAFLDPMMQYETLFTEYFDLYCTTLMPSEDPDSAIGAGVAAVAQASAQ